MRHSWCLCHLHRIWEETHLVPKAWWKQTTEYRDHTQTGYVQNLENKEHITWETTIKMRARDCKGGTETRLDTKQRRQKQLNKHFIYFVICMFMHEMTWNGSCGCLSFLLWYPTKMLLVWEIIDWFYLACHLLFCCESLDWIALFWTYNDMGTTM